MKNLLFAFFMLCLGVSYAQAPLLFASRLNVTSVTGSDPYTITGTVQAELSLWSAADISAANDSIYHLEGSDLLIYRITSISSASGNNFVLVVDDIMDSGILPSTGNEWCAVEFSVNYQFPTYLGNLSSPFRSVIDNRFKQRLDEKVAFIDSADVIPLNPDINFGGVVAHNAQEGFNAINARVDSIIVNLADTSAVLRELMAELSLTSAGYKGNATTSTNPGTPTVPVWYTTTTAGTYTNFDGLVVTETFAILSYDTTGAGAWSLSEVDVLGARGAVIDELEERLITEYTSSTETTKSYFSYTSNQSTSGAFCDRRQYINSTRLPDSLRVYAKSAGDFYVAYFSVSGNTATLLDTDTLTVVDTGVVAFKLNTVGLTLTSDSIHVALRTPTSGRLKFRTTTGTVFTVAGSGGGTVVWGTTYDLAYSVKINLLAAQDPLDTLLALPARVDAIEDALQVTTITGANLQDYINANKYIRLPNDTLTISTTITIPSYRTIEGSGRTVIKTTGNGFFIDTDTGIIIKNLVFVGDYATPDITSSTPLADTTNIHDMTSKGSDYGLKILGTSYHIVLENLEFYNFSDAGLHCAADPAGGYIYTGSVMANNLLASNCYLGFYLHNATEYNNFVNVKSHNCLIGLRIHGGNNYLSNINMSGNRVGLYLGDGNNNSHGSISNSAFNHNELYGIVSQDIDFGFYFSGCENFDGHIFLIRSIGFSWVGGYTAGSIFYTGGNSNLFHSVIFGADAVDDTNPTILNMKNNLLLGGGSATGINN